MRRRIGIAAEILNEHYQLTLYQGIRDGALERDCDLICIPGGRIPDTGQRRQNLLFEACRDLSLDGMVVLAAAVIGNAPRSAADELDHLFSGIPRVAIGYRLPGIPAIEIENRSSMASLMDHLVNQHGYRHLLYLGGPVHHADNQEREDMFRSWAQAGDRRDPQFRQVVIHGDFTEESGFRIVQDLLKRQPDDPLDAIVAANDNMALGARKALGLSDNPGWRGCAVTGFDDVPLAAIEGPPLTTVRQPLYEMGRLAIASLMALLDHQALPESLMVASTPVFRNSCGCSTGPHDQPGLQDAETLRRQWERNEYTTATIGSLCSRLLEARDAADCLGMLDTFAALFGLRDFALALVDGWPRRLAGFPAELHLAYTRIDDTATIWQAPGPRIGMRDFVERMMEVGSGHAARVILQSLHYGDEQTGYLAGSIPEALFPHLPNLTSHLAMAFKRIRTREEQAQRAQELENLVAERTRDLQAANRLLQEEMDRRMTVQRDLDALLEAMPVPLAVSDRAWGRVVYANQAFLALTGRRELPGSLRDCFLPPDLATQDIAAAGGGQELGLAGPGGELRTVLVSTACLQFRSREAVVAGFLDISARKELERDIVRISEFERERLGQDLHDDICQRMAGLSFLVEALARDLAGQGLPPATRELAGEIQSTINGTLQRTRSVARGLYPLELEDLGLVASLEELCLRSSRETGTCFRFRTNLPDQAGPVLDRERDTHLYRIAQEAIHNIVRHSGASQASLELRRQEAAGQASLELVVADAGRGMDAPRAGLGLRSMGYRAARTGGRLEIGPAPGGGTRVQVLIPLP